VLTLEEEAANVAFRKSWRITPLGKPHRETDSISLDPSSLSIWTWPPGDELCSQALNSGG